MRGYKGILQYDDNGIYEGHFLNGKECGKEKRGETKGNKYNSERKDDAKKGKGNFR